MTAGDEHPFMMIDAVLLSPPLDKKVEDACPGISLRQVEDALFRYQAKRKFVPLGGPDAKSAGELCELAHELSARLQHEHWTIRMAVDDYLRIETGARLEELEDKVGLLARALSRVEDAIAPKKGRPPSHRGNLIRELAYLVEEAGQVANAADKGPLVYLFRELMAAVGEPERDPEGAPKAKHNYNARALVWQALKKRR